MNPNLIRIFIVLAVLFIMQAVGGFFQIRNYRNSVGRIRKYGNVGLGQRRSGLFGSYLCLITCDNNGVITRCEVMDGASIFARFHEKKELMGHVLVGSTLDEWMDRFRALDKRGFKRYKGYIQAVDALCKRLYPERYTEEELNKITVTPDLSAGMRKEQEPGEAGADQAGEE